jgi:hypothetical protein
MRANKRLPSRTLILTLPAMTIEQAEKILELVDLIAEMIWTEYGPGVIHRGDPRDPSKTRSR